MKYYINFERIIQKLANRLQIFLSDKMQEFKSLLIIDEFFFFSVEVHDEWNYMSNNTKLKRYHSVWYLVSNNKIINYEVLILNSKIVHNNIIHTTFYLMISNFFVFVWSHWSVNQNFFIHLHTYEYRAVKRSTCIVIKKKKNVISGTLKGVWTRFET